MFADLSSSSSRCFSFPGSNWLDRVVKGRPNSSSADNGSLLSISVPLICSKTSWTSFLSFKHFYRGLDVFTQ